MMLRRRLSPQGRQLPPDLDTMSDGGTQGLDDFEQMPIRSISENDDFAAVSVSGGRDAKIERM